MVTIIADNYFGYCKKEVKTQISYSANLFGNAEEEHAGGALVFPSYNIGARRTPTTSAGDDYRLEPTCWPATRSGSSAQPEGHAIDTRAAAPRAGAGAAHLLAAHDDRVAGRRPPAQRSIPLRADKVYLGPNGYRVQLAQSAVRPDRHWDLIGTVPTATSCHKPGTVSGGGKSEISKAITDAFIFGTPTWPTSTPTWTRSTAILDPRLLRPVQRPRRSAAATPARSCRPSDPSAS